MLAWTGGAWAAVPCAVQPASELATSAGPDGATLVPVTLNGTSAKAMLDTGAPVSVMRESVAETMALKRWSIPLTAVTGVGGRPFEEGTLVAKLGLGTTTAENVPFLIEPRSHASNPASIGLIGADVFARYDLLLSFGEQKIGLYEPDKCVPAGWSSLPVTITPAHHVLVMLELDGERAQALVDSGASRSVMTLDAAHRLFGLDPDTAGISPIGTMGGADGGRVVAYGYPFKRLTVGRIELDNPSVLLVPDETHRVHHVITTGQPDEGLPELVLGMPELSRLQLLIAYGGRQLYVHALEPG